MTTIIVFARPADGANLDHIELVCQGISCKPVEISSVNDLYRCTFEVTTEPDKTPTLPIWVVDGMNVGERLG